MEEGLKKIKCMLETFDKAISVSESAKLNKTLSKIQKKGKSTNDVAAIDSNQSADKMEDERLNQRMLGVLINNQVNLNIHKPYEKNNITSDQA